MKSSIFKTECLAYLAKLSNSFSEEIYTAIESLSLELKDPFLVKYLDNKFIQGLIDRQTEVDKANLKLLEQEISKKKKENL